MIDNSKKLCRAYHPVPLQNPSPKKRSKVYFPVINGSLGFVRVFPVFSTVYWWAGPTVSGTG
jgi:hypothetical protein